MGKNLHRRAIGKMNQVAPGGHPFTVLKGAPPISPRVVMEFDQFGNRGKRLELRKDQTAGDRVLPGHGIFECQQVRTLLQRKGADVVQQAGDKDIVFFVILFL